MNHLLLALARKIVAGEEDAGSVESVFEQARQVAAEAEALLVDEGWHASEPEPVAAEVVAAGFDYWRRLCFSVRRGAQLPGVRLIVLDAVIGVTDAETQWCEAIMRIHIASHDVGEAIDEARAAVNRDGDMSRLTADPIASHSTACAVLGHGVRAV